MKTPAKPQISKFQVEKSCQVMGFKMLRGSTQERLLSESSRSYMLSLGMRASGNLPVSYVLTGNLPPINYR